MILPRERRLVRLYIQILFSNSLSDNNSSTSPSKISLTTILATARFILAPYTIFYNYLSWWTIYIIAQRVSFGFTCLNHRIFLADDSVHTHSPKAGQGMNTSIQDIYNLGWKLAGVLQGRYKREVLATYEKERRPIAQQLIAFDAKLAAAFGGTATANELRSVYTDSQVFAQRIAVKYRPSILMAGTEAEEEEENLIDADPKPASTDPWNSSIVKAKQKLAPRMPIGQRLPSHPVLIHASGTSLPLQSVLTSADVFRLIVFPGDIGIFSRLARFNALGAQLAPFLERYPSAIEVLTLHRGDRARVELSQLHGVFFPIHEDGGRIYDRVFVDAGLAHVQGCGKAYEGYGIDEEKGCMVLVRPDQHVCWIGGLEDWMEVERFLGGFMFMEGGEN